MECLRLPYIAPAPLRNRERAQAPHYTTVALRAAVREMGPAVLWRNFAPRMVINAVTVAVLNVCDIFHRPELSGWQSGVDVDNM